jgi:hypothetical protein
MQERNEFGETTQPIKEDKAGQEITSMVKNWKANWKDFSSIRQTGRVGVAIADGRKDQPKAEQARWFLPSFGTHMCSGMRSCSTPLHNV